MRSSGTLRGTRQASQLPAGEHVGHQPPPNLAAAAASIPETQAMYDHRVKIDAVVDSLIQLADAFTQTSNALKNVSDMYESYTELFTDESHPEVTVALKANTKIKDFLTRMSSLVGEVDQDLKRSLVAEYKIMTEMAFTDAENSLSNVDAAQRKYDAAKKTVASAKKKDVSKQLLEDDAGTADEQAGDAFAKARRECVSAYENACTMALLQNAHAFHGMFVTFGRMFTAGQTVMSDMEPWDQEITHQVASLTENAGAGQLNPKEPLTAMLEKEEQYNDVLAGISELQKKLVTDPQLKFNSIEAKHIFGNIQQIQVIHEELFTKMKAVRTAKDISQAVSDLFNSQLAMLEKIYVPYIEGVQLAVQTFERTKKANSKFSKFMKAWKKRTPSVGTVPFDVPTLLVYPSHHLYKISNCMRELLNQTDPNGTSWLSLQKTVEAMGELLETLDLAKKQSEQMKRLENLNSKLPDEKLVVGGRAYIQDGQLTVLADTCMGGASQTTANPPPLPKSPAGSGAAEGAQKNVLLQPKQQYHLFLFNDFLIVAPLPKKGEPADVFHACCRFKVDSSLSVSNVSKNSFKLDSRGRSTTWEASSAEACEQWCSNFTRIIAERAKTVVFGTPLVDVMKRPSERGRVVPSFLRRAVECVEQHGLKTEGIFRLSSEAIEFNRMCKALDAGRRPLFTDPLDAANFIKAWLRALPEPLLTNALHDKWCQAVDKGSPSLEECVQALPQENRNVLEAVIHVLCEVADNSASNKMGATNLATLVGVGILEPPSDNPFSTAGSAVVEMLINHYDEAFAQMKKDALAEAAAVEAAAVEAAAAAGSTAPVVTVKAGDSQANKRFSVMQIEDQNRLTKLQTIRRRSCSLLTPSASSGAAPKLTTPGSGSSSGSTSPSPETASAGSGSTTPPKVSVKAQRPTLPRRP